MLPLTTASRRLLRLSTSSLVNIKRRRDTRHDSSTCRRGLGTSSSPTGEQDLSGFELRQYGKDDPPRLTCKTCAHILYENPKIVTGAVATYPCPTTGEPLFLLCRRAIPPRKGYLNLCAGYMEKGESLSEAAQREAREEAGASIEVGPILGLFDISHIGQVHIYFKASLTSPDIQPGYESLDARLVRWEEIEWEELAFPTVSWALMAWKQEEEKGGKKEGGGTLPLRNPVLKGHEGSTNVWYRPDKGGLVYDDAWLHRRRRRKAEGGEEGGSGGGGAGVSSTSI